MKFYIAAQMQRQIRERFGGKKVSGTEGIRRVVHVAGAKM